MSYPNDGKRQDGATLVLCTRGKYIRLGCKLGMQPHVREPLHPATSVEGYRMNIVGCAWERSRTRCRPEVHKYPSLPATNDYVPWLSNRWVPSTAQDSRC